MDAIKEYLSMIHHSMGISGFIVCQDEIIYASNENPIICRQCPKGLYPLCVQSWRLGKEIAEKLEDPYYYQCPLYLSLVIIPIKNESSIGGDPYFCLGPIILESAETYYLQTTQNFKDHVNHAFNIQVMSDFKFHHCGKVALYTIIGYNKNRPSTKASHLIHEEVSPNAEVLKKASHNMDNIYSLESKILQCIQALERQNVWMLIKRLMSVIQIEENFSVDRIKKKFIQVYYLIYRQSIECHVNLNQANEQNDLFMKRLSLINDLVEMERHLLSAIEDMINLIEQSNQYNHNILVYKAQKYIDLNYSRPITLAEVATEMNVSYNYLSNLFNKESNMSFSDYLQNVRVSESKKLLTQTDESLSQIAMEVGFANQSYFTKVFKKTTGISPGKYRKQHAGA